MREFERELSRYVVTTHWP